MNAEQALEGIYRYMNGSAEAVLPYPDPIPHLACRVWQDLETETYFAGTFDNQTKQTEEHTFVSRSECLAFMQEFKADNWQLELLDSDGVPHIEYDDEDLEEDDRFYPPPLGAGK